MVGHPKVLVVDDENSVRMTIEAILLSGNYELFFAENGAQALAMVAEIQPDIILLDVMMPGLSGFEVCQEVRAMPGQAEVPIILVTALDDREARLSGIKAGADDFVTKPIDGHELRLRVQNMTRLNRYKQQTLYNSIELKFYESFVGDQTGYNDQNTTQLNAINSIRDYVEAEEALLVLFDLNNPKLATKKLLTSGPAWKYENSFFVQTSRLCNSITQTVERIDYGSSPLGEIDPVLAILTPP